MNLIFKAAIEISNYLKNEEWPFCIIGGLANQCWGEPRTTQDVDLTILTGIGNEHYFAEKILSSFQSRIEDALQFAINYRVLLVQSSEGVPIDISFGALPFEENMISRSVEFEFMPGVILNICSSEDLFIMKAFASRPKDWLDASGIAQKQKNKLDTKYILKHLKELSDLKEEPEIYYNAQRLLKIK